MTANSAEHQAEQIFFITQTLFYEHLSVAGYTPQNFAFRR